MADRTHDRDKNVLNTYLENGTQESLKIPTRSVKFLKVGLRTNSLGGNVKISSIGLNALLIVKTSGSAIKHATPPSSKNSKISTPQDLFKRFGIFKTNFTLYSPTFPRSFWVTRFTVSMIVNNTVAMAEAYPISNRIVP